MHELKKELMFYLLEYSKHLELKSSNFWIRYSESESGNMSTVKLVVTPSKKAVCSECKGEGTELRGSLKGMAFTGADIDDMGTESFNNMMSGGYDVACSKCKGQRVIDAPDLSNLGEQYIKDLLAYFRDFHNETLDCEAERRMEY